MGKQKKEREKSKISDIKKVSSFAGKEETIILYYLIEYYILPQTGDVQRLVLI